MSFVRQKLMKTSFLNFFLTNVLGSSGILRRRFAPPSFPSLLIHGWVVQGNFPSFDSGKLSFSFSLPRKHIRVVQGSCVADFVCSWPHQLYGKGGFFDKKKNSPFLFSGNNINLAEFADVEVLTLL